MEWITKITLGRGKTPTEALNNTLELLKKWGIENHYEINLFHNRTDCNHTKHQRCISVSNKYHLYFYQLTISFYYEYEKIKGKDLFGKECLIEQPILGSKKYYGRLKKINTSGLGSNKKEEIC